jgi:hypothetical protein
MEKIAKTLTYTLAGTTLISFLIEKPTIDFTQMITRELYLYDKIGNTLTDLRYLESSKKLNTKEENAELINLINPTYLTEEQKKNSIAMLGIITTKIDNQYARITRPSKKEQDELKISQMKKAELGFLSDTATRERVNNPEVVKKITKYLTTEEIGLISGSIYSIIGYKLPQLEKDEEITLSNDTNTKTNIRDMVDFTGLKESENFTRNLITQANLQPENKCKIVKAILGYNSFYKAKYMPPKYQYKLYKPIDIANECINNKEEVKKASSEDSDTMFYQQKLCAVYYKDLVEIKNGKIYLDTYDNIQASSPNFSIELYTLKDMAKNCDEETKKMASLPDIYYQADITIRTINQMK